MFMGFFERFFGRDSQKASGKAEAAIKNPQEAVSSTIEKAKQRYLPAAEPFSIARENHVVAAEKARQKGGEPYAQYEMRKEERDRKLARLQNTGRDEIVHWGGRLNEHERIFVPGQAGGQQRGAEEYNVGEDQTKKQLFLALDNKAKIREAGKNARQGGPVGGVYAPSASENLVLQEKTYEGKTSDYTDNNALIEIVDYRYVTIEGMEGPKLKAIIKTSIENGQEVKTITLNELDEQGAVRSSLVIKAEGDNTPKIIFHNAASGRALDEAKLEDLRRKLK
jgi:hypothetical protein